MFDTHCHLDFPAYDADREAVVERAGCAGVVGIHVPGVEPSQWQRCARLRDDFPGLVGFGVGIHPWWIDRISAERRDAIALSSVAENLIEKATRWGAEAIGECGLDGAVAKRGGVGLDEQSRILRGHLLAADALRLPVVIHVVRAHGLALSVLTEHGPLVAGGVLHSYSGSPELAASYALLGLHFSFAAVVVRPGARKPMRAACAVPQDRLLVESDGPDQPLAGYDRSEPAHVVAVASAVARARNVDATTLTAEMTTQAIRLFKR